MLIVTKGRYKNQYVVGGARLFDTITGFFKRLVTSDAAKRAASTMLHAGKDAANEIGKKAVDLGKEAAVDAGKRLLDKAVAKRSSKEKSDISNGPMPLTQKSKEILARLPVQQVSLTQKSKDILARLLAEDSGVNINNLPSGGAIKIQDLVRRLNGGGLKLV